MINLLDAIITPAYADAGAGQQGGSPMSFVLMFVVFILFMYFGIWRPQSKRNKEQRALMDSLAKGDEVVTAGGILGRISKLSDQYIVLALDDNVEMAVQRTSIVNVLPKGTIKSIV